MPPFLQPLPTDRPPSGRGRGFGRGVSRGLGTLGTLGGNFLPRRQPYMVRRNYVYEMRAAATFPMAAGLAEGAFTGVVASKYFNGGPLLVAVVTAAPMFGNIMAMFWSQWAEKRPKVRSINLLQLGVSLSVAAVGLTYFLPLETAGGVPVAGWAFAGLIIASRVLASGIATLRSAVWRLNYPRRLRGQITSRISAVMNLTLASVTFGGALWLDWTPAAYAILYPAVAVVSVLGIAQFGRIRVRGEKQLLRRIVMRPASVGAVDASGGVPTYDKVERDPAPPSGPLAAVSGFFRQIGEGFALLRRDRPFRIYQWCQFLTGSSFMMMMPSLIYMISTEMTDPTRDYAISVVVVHLLPVFTAVVALQLWAPLFDRMHLFDYRVYQGSMLVTAHLTIFAGAVMNSLWLVSAGAFVLGLSNGGGQLAWQLGQNIFATRDNVSTYMGLHVMLTGLRGMFAPFLGVGLYHTLSRTVPHLGGGDGMPGGRLVFLAAAATAAGGVAGFLYLSRRYPGFTREVEDEPARRA